MHYHTVDVCEVQDEIAKRAPASVGNILTGPLAPKAGCGRRRSAEELDSNCQSITGLRVVRWIDHGVGLLEGARHPRCRTRMEDRATTCASPGQLLLANWLRHGVVTAGDIRAALERMAPVSRPPERR